MQIEAVCCGARADKRSGIDWARTAGLAVFGAWHYGGPAKFIYLWYDRVFGKALVSAAKLWNLRAYALM